MYLDSVIALGCIHLMNKKKKNKKLVRSQLRISIPMGKILEIIRCGRTLKRVPWTTTIQFPKEAQTHERRLRWQQNAVPSFVPKAFEVFVVLWEYLQARVCFNPLLLLLEIIIMLPIVAGSANRMHRQSSSCLLWGLNAVCFDYVKYLKESGAVYIYRGLLLLH